MIEQRRKLEKIGTRKERLSKGEIMIRLGEKQTLYVVKETEFGIYLGEEQQAIGKDTILLPKRQIPEGTKKGDEIEVFVYKDSEDRLIATTKEPFITLGELAVLKVKETAKMGAFLDWGLDKDLLLPFKEQIGKAQMGHSYLVSLYIDKSKRLCATMKIYEKLTSNSPYQKDDKVKGIVYGKKSGIGIFIAVDNQYHGLIPEKESFASLELGDIVEARVIRVREDGKLDLSIREKSHLQLNIDSEMIEGKLHRAGGFLPFHDKSDPEVIKEQLGLSKAAFKRAVGHLLKEGIIVMTEKGIQLKEDN